MTQQSIHGGQLPTLREIMTEGEVIDFPTQQFDQLPDMSSSSHDVLTVIDDIRQRAHDIAMELQVTVVDHPEHARKLVLASRQAREFLLAMVVLREELEEYVFPDV